MREISTKDLWCRFMIFPKGQVSCEAHISLLSSPKSSVLLLQKKDSLKILLFEEVQASIVEEKTGYAIYILMYASVDASWKAYALSL